LIFEAELPGPLLDFCAHVSAYEVLLSEDGSGVTGGNRLIGHPGDAYSDYVDRSFAALKTRQGRLIALTAVGEAPGSGVKKPRSVQKKSFARTNRGRLHQEASAKSVVRTSSGICRFPNRLLAADLPGRIIHSS
jgi:hypothetical protein